MNAKTIAASLMLASILTLSSNAKAATFEDTCNISFYATKVAEYIKDNNKTSAAVRLTEIDSLKAQVEKTISSEISSGNAPTECLTLALEELSDAQNAYAKTQRYLASKSN